MDGETVCVEIDKSLYERLENLPGAQSRPPSQVVHDALHAYLRYRDRKDSFLRDAEESWREFQKTGQHITLEELETWMDSWGTDNELPMPKAHG